MNSNVFVSFSSYSKLIECDVMFSFSMEFEPM